LRVTEEIVLAALIKSPKPIPMRGRGRQWGNEEDKEEGVRPDFTFQV
jgi:hypothetical protein